MSCFGGFSEVQSQSSSLSLQGFGERAVLFLVIPSQKGRRRGFPGGPVVKTQRFHCQGRGFDPWLENQDLACCEA